MVYELLPASGCRTSRPVTVIDCDSSPLIERVSRSQKTPAHDCFRGNKNLDKSCDTTPLRNSVVQNLERNCCPY